MAIREGILISSPRGRGVYYPCQTCPRRAWFQDSPDNAKARSYVYPKPPGGRFIHAQHLSVFFSFFSSLLERTINAASIV